MQFPRSRKNKPCPSPKTPGFALVKQLNGIVERANRTARVERWSQHRNDLACAAMNEALDSHLDYYNNRRKHRSLGMKTPAEFARMAEVAA